MGDGFGLVEGTCVGKPDGALEGARLDGSIDGAAVGHHEVSTAGESKPDGMMVCAAADDLKK